MEFTQAIEAGCRNVSLGRRVVRKEKIQIRKIKNKTTISKYTAHGCLNPNFLNAFSPHLPGEKPT